MSEEMKEIDLLLKFLETGDSSFLTQFFDELDLKIFGRKGVSQKIISEIEQTEEGGKNEGDL